MTSNMNSLPLRRTAAAAILLAAQAVAGSPSAGTVCVQCYGPEQVYRCEATDDLPIPQNAAGLFCVSRLASEYGHAGCGVRRNAAVCEGVQVSYPYQNHQEAPAAGGEAAVSGGTEPSTLEEFTKETVDASAESMKKAGESLGNAASTTADAIKGAGAAIGTATQKTLKCLGSALNDC